ncbi:P-loop NTPase fold protein [Verrucomicrobiaceae bacterium 227]
MNDPNYHISDYLSAYLKIQDPDFAVMLTGPWGCGKTHFLNQFYERAVTDKDKPPIYISLNGINDTADIDIAIFQALHPFLGSKPVLTTKKILKSFVKLGFKVDLDADGDGKSDGHVSGTLSGINFDDFSSKAEGSIITFDDLERCSLPLESILAYINDFVERSQMPVIIVSDEKQLSKKDPNYFGIKEKVVGKTFKVQSSLEKDYTAITSITQNEEVAKIVERNKAEVLKVFTAVDLETGKHNYRSLRHCLRDFEFLFSKLVLRGI